MKFVFYIKDFVFIMGCWLASHVTLAEIFKGPQPIKYWLIAVFCLFVSCIRKKQ
jgi:hypothetical protein